MSAQEKRMVSVSSEYLLLKTAFTTLNRTLWSTELAYGYVLIDPARDFRDPKRKTRDALTRVTESQVWYPNRKGKVRYNEEVSDFLKRIRENTSFIYRAMIVFAVASFEEYLKAKVSKRPPVGKSWGPYIVSLSSTVRAQLSEDLATLLCAVFCRELRNQIAHEPSLRMPTTIGMSTINAWKASLAKLNAPLADRLTDDLIQASEHHFFGEASGCVAQAQREGRTLPIELFYLLSTFANLDKLAIEIERAMPVPEGAKQIERKPRRGALDRNLKTGSAGVSARRK